MAGAIEALIFVGFSVWMGASTLVLTAETVSGTPRQAPWWWSLANRIDYRFRWFWTVFMLGMLGACEFAVVVTGRAALDGAQYITAAIYGAQPLLLAYGVSSIVRAYR